MRSTSPRLFAVLIIATVFAVMLAWTWYTWPDPNVDFGRELYVPWQLLAGKMLYRDIAYFNGPLSPYFNMIVFAVLGVSLRSLVIVNLILLIALTVMIWRLWSQLAGAFAATVCCVLLLAVFSFLQLDVVANFNFMTPYSHEITHGVILCVALVTCFERYLAKQRNGWLITAGVICGLILLTKIEITIAATVTMIVGLILILRTTEREKRIGLIAIALLPALVAPVIAFVLLRTQLSTHDALIGLAGSWRYALDSRLADLKFYRYVTGTGDVVGSIERICVTLICYAIICAIAKLAASIGSRKTNIARWPLICSGGAFVIVSAIVVTVFHLIDPTYWQNSLRGFTILLPAMAITFLIDAWRKPADSAAALRAIVAVFATALLAKMPLNVIAFHYGFALAMPATLLVVAAALAWLPAQFARQGGNAMAARAAILPVVGLFIFVHLYVYARFYAQKTITVGDGPDAFYADANSTLGDVRGRAVNDILAAVNQLPPNATLAVMPQGVMVNYLSAHANSTPYIVLMPPEVIMFGIDKIRDSFVAHPPDYILFLDDGGRSSYEYGVGPFAGDYGKPIVDWMRQNYQPIDGNPRNPSLAWFLLQRKR